MIVIALGIFVVICMVWRGMSDLEQLATIAAIILAVIGGIGYAFGAVGVTERRRNERDGCRFVAGVA
jgi:drug/metabolite transporter (DMT)-like permease